MAVGILGLTAPVGLTVTKFVEDVVIVTIVGVVVGVGEAGSLAAGGEAAGAVSDDSSGRDDVRDGSDTLDNAVGGLARAVELTLGIETIAVEFNGPID